MSNIKPASEKPELLENPELFPYTLFCKFLESLSSVRGTKKKCEFLSKFIENWNARYGEKCSPNGEGSFNSENFYPVLRLLLPSSDYKRPAYGIGEPTMAKLLVNIFNLAPKGINAMSLIHHNSPKFKAKNSEYNLADVVSSELRDRCPLQSSITLNDLHSQLDLLANAPTQEKKLGLLAPFVRTMTILELKWFVRLVSRRDLSLGLGTNSILACLHPAAPSIWNVSQDLKVVCKRIGTLDYSKLSADLNLSQVELNVAFRPMLCSRANSEEEIESSFRQLFTGTADYNLCLEMKYDGERVQLHKSGANYRFWSRSGREWTASYGGDGEQAGKGTLTPRLHAGGFASHVKDCILDGEMVGFDSFINQFVTKATGFDVKCPDVGSDKGVLFASKSESDHIARKAGIVPCYIVFDILYLNGELLTETPLRQRKELLLSIFPGNIKSSAVSTAVANFCNLPHEEDTPGDERLLLFPIVRGAFYLGGFVYTQPDKSVISCYFASWIENGAEGLVAKGTTTKYVPAGRSKAGWWKLKPDYVLGLTTDLDCLIVGALTGPGGSGERTFVQFLLAVRKHTDQTSSQIESMDYESNIEGNLPIFFSFCTVGNGFTRVQLNDLNARLRPFWKEYDRRHVNCGETQWLQVTSVRPDFWVPPRHSVVLQIHAAELASSTSYGAGYTLRFPRVVAIRDDKKWDECASLDEIQRLSKRTDGNMLVKRRAPANGTDESDAEPETAGLFGPDLLHISNTPPSSSSSPKKAKVIRNSPSSAAKDAVSLAVQFQPSITDPNRVAIVSNSFEDQEFCLFLSSSFTGNESFRNKADIERMIIEASGRIVQNPGPNTSYVIADKATAKIENLVKATDHRRARGKEGGYDILSSDWLLECLESKYLVPIKREHVFAVRPSTKARLDACFDSFGDSFTEAVSAETLRDKLFPLIDVKSIPNYTKAEKLANFIQTELPEFALPLTACNILLVTEGDDVDQVTEFEWNLMRADLRRLDARVHGPLPINQVTSAKSKLNPDLTHIVLLGTVNQRAENKLCQNQLLDALPNFPNFTKGKLYVVCRSWAENCILEGSCLPETDYLAFVPFSSPIKGPS